MEKICTIQVDIDPLWAVIETVGSKLKRDFDLTYQKIVRIYLDLFQAHNIKASFSVIGKDLLIPENRAIVKEIAERGHEVMNHTMNHLLGFSQLDRMQKESEIIKAEELIAEITNRRPVGFRAPVFDIDEETLQILENRDYIFDSSVFPSPFSFLLKVFRYASVKLSSEGNRTSSWGRLSYVLAPRNAYYPQYNRLWRKGNMRIVEVPLNVTPIFRFPFYNYSSLCFMRGRMFNLVFLSNKSCNKHLNYLFHPIELIDPEDASAVDKRLLKIPGISIPFREKYEFCKKVLENIVNNYQIMKVGDFIQLLIKNRELK